MQITRDERDVGRLACDGAASAHGYAHMRGSQRGRIVDAIADHGDLVSFGLQFAYDVMLVLGQKVGFELVYTRHLRNLRCRARIVAREHDDALETLLLQFAHDIRHVRFERILDVDDVVELPIDRLAIEVALGIACYAVVAFLHSRRIKKVPLALALKIQE